MRCLSTALGETILANIQCGIFFGSFLASLVYIDTGVWVDAWDSLLIHQYLHHDADEKL